MTFNSALSDVVREYNRNSTSGGALAAKLPSWRGYVYATKDGNPVETEKAKYPGATLKYSVIFKEYKDTDDDGVTEYTFVRYTDDDYNVIGTEADDDLVMDVQLFEAFASNDWETLSLSDAIVASSTDYSNRW